MGLVWVALTLALSKSPHLRILIGAGGREKTGVGIDPAQGLGKPLLSAPPGPVGGVGEAEEGGY